jgi:NAD(P)-dependent dehydrogenase (short-subunit alcohol dehydrogenase family)
VQAFSDAAFKEAVFELSRKKNPVKHVGTPEEIAEAYLFLMKCTYMTGQIVTPDGGASLLS